MLVLAAFDISAAQSSSKEVAKGSVLVTAVGSFVMVVDSDNPCSDIN